MKDDRVYLTHILECIAHVAQLAHDYLGINLERVWEIVEHDLPELQQHIKAIGPS